MLPHSLVTVKTTLKALIAAFLVSRPVPLVNALYLAASTYFPILLQFAIHHVSMEHAVKPHSLVTVKTTLKALIAVFLVCVLS